MPKLVVVNGNDRDIIIRAGTHRGHGGNEYRLVVDVDGDLAFILNGVVSPYRFEPDVLFADKHQILMQLEAGEYKSYKTKGNVQFVCRGLKEAVLKWSMGYLLHVYVVAQNKVIAKLKPTGRLNEIEFENAPARGMSHRTLFSDEFMAFLSATARRHHV